jgi:hypothetical protein
LADLHLEHPRLVKHVIGQILGAIQPSYLTVTFLVEPPVGHLKE